MRIVSEIAPDGADPVHRIDTHGLCELLGVRPQTLTDLKRRELAVSVGRDAWDLRETVGRYVAHLRATASGRGGEDHVATLTAERARLAREQADAVALKNAQARGELVEAPAVERAWSDILGRVRSRILAVPSRLRAAAPMTPAEVERLDRELRDALTELGNGAD